MVFTDKVNLTVVAMTMTGTNSTGNKTQASYICMASLSPLFHFIRYFSMLPWILLLVQWQMEHNHLFPTHNLMLLIR